MYIQDGAGVGPDAKVNRFQQIDVFAIIEPEDRFANKQGKTWTIRSNTTPVGASDYIFYFKNIGTKTYAVTDIRAFSSGASKLLVEGVEGTPTFTAGVDLTPVARNLGSSEPVTATIKEDTNTTGLTTKGVLFTIPCEASIEKHLRTTSNIIIPPGTAIAMKTEGTTAVDCIWSFTEIDLDL